MTTANAPKAAKRVKTSGKPGVSASPQAGPAYTQIEQRDVDELIPYAKNARVNDREQLEALKESIRTNGFTIPILVDEKDMILAGHARVMAAKELGVKRVPVLIARKWTPEQKRLYILADNKLTERGGWNMEVLADEFKALHELGVDLNMSGFSAVEFEPLLDKDWAGLAPDTVAVGGYAETQRPPGPAEPVSVDTSKWPAAQIFWRLIGTLIPYARNARTHSDEQVSQIVESMKEFGWTSPVLVDEEGVLIAGHGRILAAEQLGWINIPVMVAQGWHEQKKNAYRVLDNKLALNAGWDIGRLHAELESFNQEFPPDFIGFNTDEMKRLNDDVAQGAFDQLGDQPATEHTNVERLGLTSDQVAFTIPMTVAQRAMIFDAIKVAKEAHGLSQAGDALCQICKSFLNPS
jgi:ParB-like chromosome segregation protein Spo0J